MNNLVKKELVLDSREVAKMVGKDHSHLMRDIDTYISYLGQNPKLVSDDFFIESSYTAGTGKTYKCYQVTKKGCELIAHKMTGEKGVQFTATYINRFHSMEDKLKQKSAFSQLSPQLQLFKQIFDSVAEQELKQKEIESKVEVVNHRINSLDCTNIQGTPQQRLNAMIRKYSYDNGVIYSKGWEDFRKAFNTAYHTNIVEKRNYYLKQHSIKNLSVPAYLTRAGLIEDSLRVADKMLNKEA